MMNWIKNRDNIFWIALGAAGVNLATSQLSGNAVSWLNLISAGFCFGMAFFLPMIDKLRALAADQSEIITRQAVTITAQSAEINATSPTHMRTMLQGALTEVVTTMRRDGTLPPELEVQLQVASGGHKPPKLLQ